MMSLTESAIEHGPPISDRLPVAFVNTHPIQYFAPLYAYLEKRCNFTVSALYLSDFSLRGGHDDGFGQALTWDVDLLGGYRASFMGEAAARRRMGGFFSMVAPELWSAIRGGGFAAVVIHGHSLAAYHVALAAAKSSGTPAFARSDTHLGQKRAPWRNAVRTPLLRAWYRAFDGFLAIGTANARYYRAMGVPDRKIFMAPYAVDNDRFIAAAQQTPGDRAAMRTRLGIRGAAPAILYAAKFQRRKRAADLMAAFQILRSEFQDLNLVMVGSGEVERELRSMVAELRLENVSFPGFVNQAELPRVYAACDAFVLPSENEPWGLAVNEAMCAGLPVVVSQQAGCAEDLVEDGVNGATFKAGDVAGLAAALRPIIADAGLRTRYGSASRAKIETWSYRECGKGLRDAIQAARLRCDRAGREGRL
jgi:glycosyltransferase involved in cell wall biosynthesis